MSVSSEKENEDLLVVGLGASAGGLEALKTFFKALPENPGMAFIVIVHLSPKHESSMASLLQGKTTMEVMQVQGRIDIKHNCAYIIPPNKVLMIGDNHLELSEPESTNKSKPQVIDQFYRSLGETKGTKGVCITLSGTGSDGAVGIKTVKEHGGLAIAQDPDEAQYRGMPQSAIDTGMVDKVLPIKKIPEQLINYKKALSAVRISDDPDNLSEEAEKEMLKIFTRLREETSHDFSHYKRSTMLRRIERRMHVQNTDSLDEYLSVLEEDVGEVQELFKDLLISVTNFFRDPEAFEALEKKVIHHLFSDKDSDDELRVWVPGCATGEEAYSIAMLLHRYARNIDHPPQIQIFATDIDEQALEVARRGEYTESINADLSDQYLRRFFNKDGYRYMISEELRNMILFSKHNLLGSPPFSRLDLISCRNLLIYLDKDLQGEVFNIFHYALKQNGFLFLGKSDSNLQATELFKPFDKEHRIYRPSTRSRSIDNLPDFPLQFPDKASVSHSWKMPSKTKSNIEQLHQKLITRHYGPPSVLINEDEEVLHSTHGTGIYLNYAEGAPSRNILDMVISGLRQPLRSILYRAKKDKNELPVSKLVQVEREEEKQSVQLTVDAIKEKDFPGDLLHVVFKKVGDLKNSESRELVSRDKLSDEETEIIEELEDELRETKEQLQITVEDYETTNEELRSSNEELQSMNEELQSTTEELETSREELQSVNEELKTVNMELEGKIENLTEVNSDLKNLMEATEIAIIFVDRDFRLQRFTDEATVIFNLTSSDEGRPLKHFTHRLNYNSIQSDIEEVLGNLNKIQKEVVDEDNNYYIMRLRPYQTTQGNIEGVVMTFVDVTELKAAQNELAEKIEHIKKLQRQILKANVSERWKVGQYLHDELAQSLLAAQLTLDQMNNKLDEKEINLTEDVDRLRQIIGEGISDVRNLSHQILPVDVEQQGVVQAFRNIAKYIENTYGLNCILEGVDVMDSIDDMEVATHLYRVAQEAVKNAAVHGDAETVKISLQADEYYIYMDIEDDGVGLDATKGKEEGMGIHIMRHRMELMDGTLEIKESSHFGNTGVHVSCKMPLDRLNE